MSSKCQVSDPADAFVCIFDQLPDDAFLGDEAEELNQDAAVMRDATAVEKAVLNDGKVPPTLVKLPADPSQRNLAAFTRLIGLDQVLRRVHPNAQAPPPPILEKIAMRYARTGRFNTKAVPGLLLPQLTEYAAPIRRRNKHQFFSVVRVEPEWMNNVEFRVLGSRGWQTTRHSEEMVVACLPFLDTIDDVNLQRIEKRGGARYRLAPADSNTLQQRVDDAIAALDQSDATIGLLPEGSLSGELLEVWKTRLAATYARGGSQLAMIIAGTGPVTGDRLPRNRAVVLDREGNPLWQQDKLCDYTLVHDTVHKHWKLPGLGEGDLREDIKLGDQLVVVETTLGRLAILICEDLQRSDERDIVPRHYGVSHIFTPVFDAPLGENRWQRHAAAKHVSSIGSRVVVSNSRVVGNLQDDPPQALATALGVSPPRVEGTFDQYKIQIPTTDSPTSAVCIRLPALGPPPSDPDADGS